MRDYLFDWDEKKNKSNVRKHGISFLEARTVFLDENAIFIADTEHSELEDRFHIIGFSGKLRLLVVCHCYRYNDVVRIISARKANRNEKEQYGGAT